MKILRIAAAAAALCLSVASGAQAQTTLRIGLAEDPDILDPTLARTYVGRIVFASFCDKLFDIDEKVNIVPQLALSHEPSADRKIPCGGAPRCGSRKILDRAASDDDGFVPETRARHRRPRRGGRSADHQDRAEGAVLAVDCAAHRPRRH